MFLLLLEILTVEEIIAFENEYQLLFTVVAVAVVVFDYVKSQNTNANILFF